MIKRKLISFAAAFLAMSQALTLATTSGVVGSGAATAGENAEYISDETFLSPDDEAAPEEGGEVSDGIESSPDENGDVAGDATPQPGDTENVPGGETELLGGIVNVPVDTSSLPDSNVLLARYLGIEELFYGNGVSPYKNQGLTELNGTTALDIYKQLKAGIDDVAAGRRTDTKINVTYKTHTTAFEEDVRTALDYLLVDLPAEFYWFDKTKGVVMSNNGVSLGTVSFAVSADYAAGSEEDGVYYTVNSEKIDRAKDAVARAAAIEAKYKGLSDYRKALAFKNEICDLTEYNYSAAENTNTPYGDPWQLISVFDNDPSTKVVCEGYAKAFQYLCDLGNVPCYTVSGEMDGGTGAGDHMWNIVVLDGESYLVDVTNCDALNSDGLFLKGAVTASEAGCTFDVDGRTIRYSYTNMSGMYAPEILTVSTNDFGAEVICEHEGGTATCTERAKCTKCGEYYGELLSHSYNGDGVCIVGGEPGPDHVHTWEWKYEGNRHHEECKTCHEKRNDAAHNFNGNTYEHDPDRHWKVCVCGKASDTTAAHRPISDDVAEVCRDCGRELHRHEGGTATCQNKAKCTICAKEYGELGAHKFVNGKCTVCGEADPGHEHTYSSWIDNGNEHYGVCSVCGDETRGNHQYMSPLTSENANADGHWRVCVCGKRSPDTLPHRSSGEATMYREETCLDCGYVISPKLDHEHSWDTSQYKADDDNHWFACTHTGCNVHGIEHAHVLDQGVVVRAATCSKEGEMRYTCTICGYTVTRTIEKLAHTPDAVWNYNTTQHWHKCWICGEDVAKENHVWDSGKETVKATCTANGVMTYTCTICKQTRTESTPKTAHTPGSTWGGDDIYHWIECKDCKTPSNKIAHTWDNGSVTKQATCKDEGEMTFNCTVCKYKRVVKTGKTAHEPDTTWKNDENQHWFECKTCKQPIEKINHRWNLGTVTKQATCTQDGEITYTCSVCNYSKKEAVTAHHSFNNYRWQRDANTHSNVCTVCGEEINKQPHSFDSGRITRQPTCGVAGERSYTCKVCAWVETEPIAALSHTPGATRQENLIPATADRDGAYNAVVRCTVCNTILSSQTVTIPKGTSTTNTPQNTQNTQYPPAPQNPETGIDFTDVIWMIVDFTLIIAIFAFKRVARRSNR